MGQPDPFIFFHQGIYYIYATHVNGVQLYCSRELTGGWQYKGLCFAMEHEKITGPRRCWNMRGVSIYTFRRRPPAGHPPGGNHGLRRCVQ